MLINSQDLLDVELAAQQSLLKTLASKPNNQRQWVCSQWRDRLINPHRGLFCFEPTHYPLRVLFGCQTEPPRPVFG
ncbi:MAG: hypothetical protein BJG00_018185 [Limnothrix sp. CACIAM 69d]|nr:MAG: hypothetical protein BJG00_018185 [Limnothrix sp. CACIAM 69d]